MFKFISNYYNSVKERHSFNAINCRRKQTSNAELNFIRKVEEISARIKFVSENSLDEHCVVYTIHSYDRDLFPKIKEHFEVLGFTVVQFTVEALSDEFYLISW